MKPYSLFIVHLLPPARAGVPSQASLDDLTFAALLRAAEDEGHQNKPDSTYGYTQENLHFWTSFCYCRATALPEKGSPGRVISRCTPPGAAHCRWKTSYE
jgi:hypothetical protein